MKRLFISMVLVMSAQLSMVAANTYTVYFDNSKSNWDTVYAWIWDADNGDKNYTGGTWPGTLMTLNSDGLYEYTFTTDDNPTGLKVIFAEKDGGEQTSDLTFVNGDTYDVTGDEAAAEQTWTVYYDNSESAWTTVYAYIWADGNAQPLGGWPGTVMTKNTDGTWMLTFTTKYDLVNAYIMFDDGAGNPADTDETDGNGFAFENGATYNYEGKTSSGSSSGNTGGTGETVESYTVTFTDNGSPAWSTVYIYVYD
ncbi:MAG: starch-binding protein, partial [Prevotella sp.]|nr:starch-binding protein [Prevotella sp.]